MDTKGNNYCIRGQVADNSMPTHTTSLPITVRV